jgi:ketosteroid isomerase-like protein
VSQNLEKLRSMFDAYNRRDFDGAVEDMHPQIELRPGLTELDVDSLYRGRDEVKRFFNTITHAWESYVVEPVEVIEASDERIVVVEQWRARGRQGIELSMELTDMYTFEHGLLVRIDGFADRAGALEAAGATSFDEGATTG